MALTPSQIATLKQALFAETDPVLVGHRNAGATSAMQDWYNAPGPFVVWRTHTQTNAVFDAVIWSNLTPADAPDLTQAWANRSLACQGKQFNLQTLLAGRESIASGKVNIRTGLQDALTSIPSGAGGASVSAGWQAVRTTMQRQASRAEALYATGTGTAGSPGIPVFDGALVEYDIVQAFYQ